jgi:plastocyanin
MRSRRELLVATAGLSTLGGCLGGSTDTAEETTGDTPTAETSGFAVGQPGDYELPVDPAPGEFADGTGTGIVEIETRWRKDRTPEFVFDPPFVRVEAGTTIQWVNGHDVYHTVTATESLETRSPSGEFNSQLAGEGDTVEWVAGKSGRQPYCCTPHAGFMYGSVAVI